MGGASSLWYTQNKRKVLILSFEDVYLQLMGNCLTKKDVKIKEPVGFVVDKLDYNDLDLSFWFLTVKNRHLWRHHYFGAQGVILVFSFKEKGKAESLLVEAMNVFSDSTLSAVPILILLDSSNADNEIINETFRSKINNLDRKPINTQYVDFSNNKEELRLGLNWLSEVMQPI